MNDDQVILDPKIPGNIHNGSRLMLQRKAANAQEAYQVACFWWELLTINPHLHSLCRAQIEAQQDWANTNAAEAETILKQDYGKASAWATNTTEKAQFWAAEVQVLMGRADSFNPEEDVPAWAASNIAQVRAMPFVASAEVNGAILALVPSIGRVGLLMPLITQTVDGLKPLNIQEDRTTEQRQADGDLAEPPSHCKACGAQLVFVAGRKHSYVHCAVCSDPARYYLIHDRQGNWALDPNPPTTSARKHTERIESK